MDPLVALYATHVLGDGHGLATQTDNNTRRTEESPQGESAVQRRKRLTGHRAQQKAIAEAIDRFRALDDDW